MDALKPFLTTISSGMTLSAAEATQAFEIILAGEATSAQIGAFLMALRVRGETVEEITAGAQVMRRHALAVKAPDHALDTCGTGGDGTGTFNISTATALVVAACGVHVAKHGNRALSSNSGSSQVLEHLGVHLDVGPTAIENCIREAGIGFMFAPNHHAAGCHLAVKTAMFFKRHRTVAAVTQSCRVKAQSMACEKCLIRRSAKIMGYIDREAKSMRSFIGKTYNGDVSSTMEVFDWNPIPFKKTVLDTAKSIESYLNKID